MTRKNRRCQGTSRWAPPSAFCISILIFKSAAVSCLIVTSHQHQSRSHRASRRSKTCLLATDPSYDKISLSRVEKSPESSFWNAIPQKSLPSSFLPAIHQIDRETGPLPPGAYRNIECENTNDELRTCVIAVGIRPPADTNSGNDVWTEAVKNCQKLIDSGFNTYSVGDKCISESSKGGDKPQASKQPPIPTDHQQQYTSKTTERHQSEIQFYHKLRQSTPSSVLRSCHFSVKMEVPAILTTIDPYAAKKQPIPNVPFGNGWMVRKTVSDALLRIKTDCLDTINLEYNPNSPYHLDVLNTLNEMKFEGSIKSISTRNFPPFLLQSALECGFDIHGDESGGSLLDTFNLQVNVDNETTSSREKCKQLITAPLAGGLLTNQFAEKEDIRQLTSYQKKLFDECCNRPGGATEKWKHYRLVMDTLIDLSVKYQVSIESVELRWLLQQNPKNNMISVGSNLGMDLVEEKGGAPYRRGRDLRQVFSFSLDDEDVDQLWKVSGFPNDNKQSSTPLDGNQRKDYIDLNDKSLWL